MTSAMLVRRIAALPAIVLDILATEEGLTFWRVPEDFPAISAAGAPERVTAPYILNANQQGDRS